MLTYSNFVIKYPDFTLKTGVGQSTLKYHNKIGKPKLHLGTRIWDSSPMYKQSYSQNNTQVSLNVFCVW